MENIPIKYEKRIIALYEMSISISDPDVHWSETVPQDQKMPDCLSSKGIGWLGDRGRKGGRLASGNTTPLQTRGRAFLLFFKKKKCFTPKFFILLVSLTFWTKSGEMWLSNKSMVLAFPRDPKVSARTFPDSMSF